MGETGILGHTEPVPAGEATFYQPEPALLTIASGEEAGRPQVEQERRRGNTVETPPTWIPDSMAPLCKYLESRDWPVYVCVRYGLRGHLQSGEAETSLQVLWQSLLCQVFSQPGQSTAHSQCQSNM